MAKRHVRACEKTPRDGKKRRAREKHHVMAKRDVHAKNKTPEVMRCVCKVVKDKSYLFFHTFINNKVGIHKNAETSYCETAVLCFHPVLNHNHEFKSTHVQIHILSLNWIKI